MGGGLVSGRSWGQFRPEGPGEAKGRGSAVRVRFFGEGAAFGSIPLSKANELVIVHAVGLDPVPSGCSLIEGGPGAPSEAACR